jgi:glucoamylase
MFLSFYVLISFIASYVKASEDICSSITVKYDCGYSGIDQTTCEGKGCCWNEATDGSPWCFNGQEPKSCYASQDKMQLPFTSSEVETMRDLFLKNINIDGKGGIVAAPDQNTPGGSYYYHWMRDGALTMRSLQETTESFDSVVDIVKSYVSWVLHVQSGIDTNDQDIRTEPKFNLPDGSLFTDPWCRPQNDGPGLRATSLMIAAQSLIDAGEMEYVKQYLWTGDDTILNGGAIKYDLDYVINGYDSNTCDLWYVYFILLQLLILITVFVYSY